MGESVSERVDERRVRERPRRVWAVRLPESKSKAVEEDQGKAGRVGARVECSSKLLPLLRPRIDHDR